MERFINQIICGDCLKVMPEIPDKSIDMILCDLPYGTTQNKWDSVIPLDKLWVQYERIIKDKGVIVLTASQPFTSMLVMSNLKLFKYEWIWIKKIPSNFLNAKKQPLRIHEHVVVFYKKGNTYNPQGIKRNPKINKRTKSSENFGKHELSNFSEFENYPNDILEFSNERGLHPTQKPVELFEYLIRTYTNEGDLVLDNCIGSGTTAIACINTKRNFIGIELEEKYYKIALERVAKTPRPL